MNRLKPGCEIAVPHEDVRNIAIMALIDIHGVRLEVQHIPANTATHDTKSVLAPLIFLHEGLGSVAMWRDWPAQLCAATGRAGWVYSRRGYGQSSAVPDVRGPSRVEGGQRVGRLLPDYMHEEAWRVLPELLRVLNIDKPVLVGHSDGASIALLCASRLPVAACVVMAPHVIVEDISVRAITEARVAYETSGGDGNSNLRARLARYHADVDCAFWQWNDAWLSPEFRAFDIREHCRTIGSPVLALQGVDDPYGSMLQIDEIANALNETGSQVSGKKRCQLQKLEHCGHSPHRDQAEESTRLIVEFLRDLP